MSHALSHRAHAASRRGIAIVAIAALSLPIHTVSAQFGGLVKKARDKAVEQQIEKRVPGASASNPGAPPKFDDVTVELTADRVGQILRGFAAGRAILDGTNGGASRASLVARRDEASRKREALNDANMKAFNAYTNKRDESQRCRSDGRRSLRHPESTPTSMHSILPLDCAARFSLQAAACHDDVRTHPCSPDTRTRALPSEPPSNRAMKARGAFSRPSKMVFGATIRPLSTSGFTSSRNSGIRVS